MGLSMNSRISIMRLTFSWVSVTRRELVRSRYWIWPSGRLKLSMTFWASSAERFLGVRIWRTICPCSG